MIVKTYYKNQRQELISFIPLGVNKILEIGCGAGTFRENMSSHEEYWGVELVPSIAAEAKKKLDYVLAGSYDEVQGEILDGYFDLIICNDVIEHMNEYDYFIDSLKKKLSTNGFIMGSIPNVRHYKNLYNIIIKKDWRYTEEGILDKTHLRFFTYKSIKRLFIENQLEILRIGGVSPPKISENFAKWLVIKLFSKFLGDDIQYVQFGFLIQPKK